MAINVSDLPPKYQAQVMQKYMAQEQQKVNVTDAALTHKATKPSKYHNTRADRMTESGTMLHFDSQKEARRYDQLMMRMRAGEINDLRLQVDFTLQEAYTDLKGNRIRAIKYIADFTYERDGVTIIEDVKSTATKKNKVYTMKKKMMQHLKGIEIQEV